MSKTVNKVSDYIEHKPIIMIADDDKLVRKIITDFLINEHYNVIDVPNGKQVTDLFPLVLPDLILLDVVMPIKDGITTCRELRHSHRSEYTPIIMITALDGDKHIDDVFLAGADDFITKPVNKTILRHRVRRLIEAETHRKDLEALAYYDNLTQVYNRQIFFTRFAEEFQKAQIQGTYIGIILSDVDNFKGINDKYGHIVGDIVLKNLADTITRNCRKYDFVGRYGGDEFIICLPNTSLRELKMTAEQIRAGIEELHIETSDNHIFNITSSFGLKIISPAATDSAYDILKAAIRLADKNLYQAKTSGKNAIIS
ncbi:GGDEF domain-containing protein [Pectinatus frisingensis]|uniref:GGDEF domain-containing protein n=1 Tax=Pectinatus frisingensis TaxID=865 RepID=UPI0018C7464E|nr:diguanylate cyclase [Pectinatus frisingensis]